jgi:hypothetical protein
MKPEQLTETIPTVQEPTVDIQNDCQHRYFLRKQKRDKDGDEVENAHRDKLIRVMIAMSIYQDKFTIQKLLIYHVLSILILRKE